MISAPGVFSHQKTRIHAQSLLFTPATNMIVLLGNERQPVEWWNGDSSNGTFTELWYDTEREEPLIKSPRIQARP